MREIWIGKQELPYDEGQHAGATAYWRDVVPGGKVLAPSATMTDLAPDHVLFNAGFLHAVTGQDQVALYWAERARPGRPAIIEVGVRLFAGEMPEPFDRVCFACPAPEWPGLCRHLDRLAFMAKHGDHDVVWESVHDVWPVLDPATARRLAVGRPAPAEPPTAPVHLYGLTSPVGAYVWESSPDHWRVPPCLKWVPPTPQPPKAQPPKADTTLSSSRFGATRTSGRSTPRPRR